MNNKRPGWLIQEGVLNDNRNANLWECVEISLYSGKHRTTYKYGFLESLLSNLYATNDQFEINLEDINDTFALIYWNLIIVHHLPQMSKVCTGEKNGLVRAFDNIVNRYPESNGVHFESLSKNIQSNIRKETYKVFIKNVIGAFYADTSGYIYGFSKRLKKLWLNERSIEFLNNYKKVVEQLNYFEWVKMIETIQYNNNEPTYCLSTVIENITVRNNLLPFKKELLRMSNANPCCFYCHKSLHKNMHVDHVIPWSFIKNDYLWNFVLACPECNSSKNNNLPDAIYINELIDRNIKEKIDCPDIKKIVSFAMKNGIKNGWKPRG